MSKMLPTTNNLLYKINRDKSDLSCRIRRWLNDLRTWIEIKEEK